MFVLLILLLIIICNNYISKIISNKGKKIIYYNHKKRLLKLISVVKFIEKYIKSIKRHKIKIWESRKRICKENKNSN